MGAAIDTLPAGLPGPMALLPLLSSPECADCRRSRGRGREAALPAMDKQVYHCLQCGVTSKQVSLHNLIEIPWWGSC